MIGETISHYKITAKLGEGGMGVVYKAEDTRLKRIVALKFLSDQALGNEEQKARFLREAQAVALLDHPNIAAVHDIGEEDGHTFMAIAFVDGPELSDKIKERPLKLDEALDIAIQICEGLKEAHEQGVTHRDIKPSNIMLTRKGRVKITDFGLAHLAGRSKLTKSGTSLGTPAYMSPEQALSEETDRRSDIWGVGVVLYEMLAGRVPFDSDYEQAMVYSIINEDYEPLTAVRTGLPTELDRVVGKALAKRQEERYQHVDDFLVDLRRLQKQLTSRTSESSSTQTAVATPQVGPEPEGKSASALTEEGKASEHPLTKYRVIEDPEEQDDAVSYVAEDTERRRFVSIRVVPQSSAQRMERLQRRRRNVALAAGAIGMVIGLIFALAGIFSPAPVAEAPLRRLTLSTPETPHDPSISPDGRYVAYLTGTSGNAVLWVQDLTEDQPHSVAGPGGIWPGQHLAWSPDSRFLCFQEEATLRKVAASGGPVTAVCQLSALPGVKEWAPDGESIIINMGGQDGLFQVAASGGEPEPWLEPQQEGYVALDPQFFSATDGLNKFLYVETRRGVETRADAQIYAVDRASGRWETLASGHSPRYAQSGHVVYFNPDPPGVWALPFSVETMSPTGDPFLIKDNATAPSVSLDGTLVYLEGTGLRRREQLVWRDRRGKKLGTIGQPQDIIWYPALSPDGKRVAVFGQEGTAGDIWIHEVKRPVKEILTTHQARDLFPTWSPSGDRVAFSSGRSRSGGRDLYVKRADGSGEVMPLLLTADATEFLTDWSRDESILLFTRAEDQSGDQPWDIYYLRKSPDGRYEEAPFLTEGFNETTPVFSPDERFVAYTSDESGRREVYIRSFPDGGGKKKVSVQGGALPRWRADGKELFYVEGDTMMAVPVTTSPSLTVGVPVSLFPGVSSITFAPLYDVTPDGDRFVLVEPAGEERDVSEPRIRVVQNWYEEFRRRE